MIFELFVIFLIPVILTLIFTPFVIKLAEKIGAIDLPNERKVHQNPTPRLGGVAIYMSFFLSSIIALNLFPSIHPFASMSPQTNILLVASLTLVLILGIWDDLKQLTPGKKFAVQLVAAMIVYAAGFRISSVTSPMDLGLLNLGIFNFPATILWIVLITNAFNLIDGLDGLASGVAFIVAITISAVSFLRGDIATAILTLLLAGSVLGFLRYNFNRARIFLGDSGSLFIGFSLAIFSMHSSTKGSTAFSLLVPMLALGLPLIDTLLSMVRRFLKSILPEQQQNKSFANKLVSMFHPDKGHIHHQLISLGFSHKNVVLLLYIVSILFGVGAFAVTLTNTFSALWIFVTIGIATIIGITRLSYKEMAIFRNGVLLPLYERPLINNTFFLVFLDIAFIIIAHSIATFLTNNRQGNSAFDKLFFSRLILICGIRFSIFYFAGLYKSTYRQWGMGDISKLFKATAFSVLTTFMVFAILPDFHKHLSITRSVIDFYILLTLVMGVRLSYHILNYISRQSRSESIGKNNVLIYGADNKGMLMIQEILDSNNTQYCPVGFLDDDPKLEGKKLNGYPIFGGHWKLERLINKFNINEVVITNGSVRPMALSRILEVAHTKGIVVRKLKVRLDNYHEAEKNIAIVNKEYSLVSK
jgi:UDP-GlcNAc:undecaprenyl-phosphate/decaprenyl-phosphate GlcNAc-1-phosphate transferase